jgi:hypothetical protein
MIFWAVAVRHRGLHCLFMQSEGRFRFNFRVLKAARKNQAQAAQNTGLNDVHDLALFLWASLRVILWQGACPAAGLFSLHLDGAEDDGRQVRQ